MVLSLILFSVMVTESFHLQLSHITYAWLVMTAAKTLITKHNVMFLMPSVSSLKMETAVRSISETDNLFVAIFK